MRLHHEAAPASSSSLAMGWGMAPAPHSSPRVGAGARTAAGQQRGGWRSSRPHPVTLPFVPWLALGTREPKVAREGDTGASPGPACQGRPRRRPAGAVGHRGGWAIAVAPDKPQVSGVGQTCTARAEVQAHARGRAARRAMTPSARAARLPGAGGPAPTASAPPCGRQRPARRSRVAGDCARGWGSSLASGPAGPFSCLRASGSTLSRRPRGRRSPRPGSHSCEGGVPGPSAQARPAGGGLLESGRGPTGGGSESLSPRPVFSRGLGGGPPQASEHRGWDGPCLEATWEAASLAAGALRPGQWGSRWVWPARATMGGVGSGPGPVHADEAVLG